GGHADVVGRVHRPAHVRPALLDVGQARGAVRLGGQAHQLEARVVALGGGVVVEVAGGGPGAQQAVDDAGVEVQRLAGVLQRQVVVGRQQVEHRGPPSQRLQEVSPVPFVIRDASSGRAAAGVGA